MNFRVNGLTWEFQSVRREDEKLKVRDDECLGVTYFKDLQIFVDCTLSRELFRQTVIHELVHAFAFSYGAQLEEYEKAEELLCNFMGAHLDEIYITANKIMEGRL